MADIKFDHVDKYFGNVHVLKDLNIDIPDQEFLVLVGPSGCGKSTALRCLAGLEEISTGRIYIGDRVVNNIAMKDRDIAMVFQSYALYPHMSVYDNMAFGLKLRKTPKTEIDKRVKEVAEILGVAHLLDRKPKALSGGQRQRLALGRAIVRDPAVFLMDEPLSNLDAKLRVQTRAEISKLHQRLKTTFIYVTHDQVEAMTMGTRLAVMRDGILQQLDVPQVIYTRPANMFVAGFIGSPAMNFFEATLKRSQNGLAVDTGVFSVPVPPSKTEHLGKYIDRPVYFGIRPEDIHDANYVPPRTETIAHVVANITAVEDMGAEVYAYANIGDREFVGRLDARTSAEPTSQLRLAIDLSKMHVFDGKTEVAIDTSSSMQQVMLSSQGYEILLPPKKQGDPPGFFFELHGKAAQGDVVECESDVDLVFDYGVAAETALAKLHGDRLPEQNADIGIAVMAKGFTFRDQTWYRIARFREGKLIEPVTFHLHATGKSGDDAGFYISLDARGYVLYQFHLPVRLVEDLRTAHRVGERQVPLDLHLDDMVDEIYRTAQVMGVTL